MELWIRSQDKKRLIKTNILELSTYELNKLIFTEEDIGKGDCKIFANEHIYIGTYKTKERALEILDEIAAMIKNRYIVSTTTAIVSKDDIANEYKRLNYLYSGEFIMENPPFEIKPINKDVIYYEMPEE